MNPKPKYTKKQVERAGKKLPCDSLFSNGEEFSEVMDILSFWRFSHEVPLERAFEILQEEVLKVEKRPIFGKRLKRHSSISLKLRRFDKMSLKNMQDIGGCRAVASSQKKVRKVVAALKKYPEFRNSRGNFKIKDYIKKPKDDGYRSFHIIGYFPNQAGEKKLIEIQLRTYIQHYWATALEIVDIFTNQALKSNQGDKNWADFFIGTSYMFALIEDIPLFHSMSAGQRLQKFSATLRRNPKAVEKWKDLKKLMAKLKVIKALEAYANSLQIMNEQIETKSINGYVILIITIKETEGEVLSKVFTPEGSQKAEEEYIKSEKKYAGKDNVVVAMVSTSSMGEIKTAYPNYFADSSSFIALLHLIRIATP